MVGGNERILISELQSLKVFLNECHILIWN